MERNNNNFFKQTSRTRYCISFQQDVPPLKLGNSTSAITPCDEDDTLCESDDDLSYPTSLIDTMLETHVAFKSPSFFGAIFGDICEPQDNNKLAVRAGFDLELSELCSSFQKYIYPKKAKNTAGEWHYIINTDQYRQGVTVEICLGRVKGFVKNIFLCVFALTTLIFGCLKYGRRWSEFIKVS